MQFLMADFGESCWSWSGEVSGAIDRLGKDLSIRHHLLGWVRSSCFSHVLSLFLEVPLYH